MSMIPKTECPVCIKGRLKQHTITYSSDKTVVRVDNWCDRCAYGQEVTYMCVKIKGYGVE